MESIIWFLIIGALEFFRIQREPLRSRMKRIPQPGAEFSSFQVSSRRHGHQCIRIGGEKERGCRFDPEIAKVFLAIDESYLRAI